MKPSKRLVISQTPYRISLGGGGTDLPFYASKRGGWLITASIDQYVKVSVATRPLDDKIMSQTTTTQFVDNIDDINHDLVREALRFFKLLRGIQVATFTTIPTGIGLGTSSTIMVGLVKALSLMVGQSLSPIEIATTAHHIERNVLKFSGGVQDQYISALGGIQILNVDTSGEVTVKPLYIDEYERYIIEKHLVLIYTGKKRDSRGIIDSQSSNDILSMYDKIKEIGYQSVDLLKNADIQGLGELMDDHWSVKRTLSDRMSSYYLNKMYIKLKNFGSPGGKIVGAGGGGFYMMAVPDDVETYLQNVRRLGFRCLPWKFEFTGTRSIDTI